MADSLSVESTKLEWAVRLSALLLNDATDVVRWFLLENLPMKGDRLATLSEVLSENRPLLSALRDGSIAVQFINNEMFDILYRENKREVDPADLELGLIFVLIRFLCKIQHPSWKFWDEEPGNHQVLPLFDVIRIVRFKERMKGIVHSYEITQESFAASWRYITPVLDRLQCYRVSSRRWFDDVIGEKEPPEAESVFRKFVDVMRWQTKELGERDEIYLNLKESRELKRNEENSGVQTWDQFSSRFGQHRHLKLSSLNRPKLSMTQPLGVTESNQRPLASSPAFLLHCKHVKASSISVSNENRSNVLQRKSMVTKPKFLDDLKMLDRIDNRVYIADTCQGDDFKTAFLKRIIKRLYILKRGQIRPLPSQPFYVINMDNVVINLSRIDDCDEKELCRSDVIKSLPPMTSLTAWTEMLDFSFCKRKLLFGDWSSGKTVLLRKIAYDWASRNHVTLTSFRFVFSLDLALVKLESPYTRLSDAILEQCVLINCDEQPCTVTSDDIEDLFVNSSGSDILLLLDNFDRMQGIENEELSEFYDVIIGHLWPKCNVIMTSSYLPHQTEEEKMAENLLVLKDVPVTWEHYVIEGFTKYDVTKHSKKFFDVMEEKSRVSEFLNFIQVYQRDVYDGVVTSPIMTYLLCDARKEISRNFKPNKPCPGLETTYDILKISFNRCLPLHTKHQQDPDLQFSREVLSRKLLGDSCSVYSTSSYNCELIKLFLKHGIMISIESMDRNTNQVEVYAKFSHVLYEDLFAARIASDKTIVSRDQLVSLLQEHVTTLGKSHILRNFFQLCCAASGLMVETIVGFLTELLHRKSPSLNSTDATDSSLHEATKLTILHCFYEAKSSPQTIAKLMSVKTFTATEIETPIKELTEHYNSDHKWPINYRGHDYRKDGIGLQFKYGELLSNKSMQALVFLSDRCRPTLTSSGSVRSSMTSPQFWIRHLYLNALEGKNMHLVVLALGNLPFMEELFLPNAKLVTDNHVAELCRGLSVGDHRGNCLRLHTLLFTLEAMTSPFAVCDVTNYLAIGRAVKKLPLLEYLHLSLNDSLLFFSLFDEESKWVVPLVELGFPACGFDTQQCARLASLLKRVPFLQRLDLSENQLEGGLANICENLHHLQDLQVLSLHNACLNRKSFLALSTATLRTNLGQTLRHLDVRESYLQDESAIKALVQSLTSLKVLEYFDISHNFVGDVNACVIARAFQGHPRLRCLRMSCVQIGTVALSALKYHLRDCHALEILDLGENYFGDCALDFTQVFLPIEGFSKAIPQATANGNEGGLRSLKDLDLSGIGETMATRCSPESVTSFVACVTAHRKLKTVRLCDAKLEIKSLVELLEACENHSTIESVVMSEYLNVLTKERTASWRCLQLV